MYLTYCVHLVGKKEVFDLKKSRCFYFCVVLLENYVRTGQKALEII
jgi:hypothetical protein